MLGWVRSLAGDLLVSLGFCTRLPIARRRAVNGTRLARASWAFPIAGLIVGLLGALTYWLAWAARLPSLPAAALVLAATAAVTGCLHEDGLADMADGFGGGRSRARTLEIMRDSRIGSFGACALGLSLLLRAGALASLVEPARVTVALMVAHSAARATLPGFMLLVPPARTNGLAAGATHIPPPSAVVAALIGVAALAIGLGGQTAAMAVIFLGLLVALTRSICIRQIGGQTGDVLGALEQGGEILVLLIAAGSL